MALNLVCESRKVRGPKQPLLIFVGLVVVDINNFIAGEVSPVPPVVLLVGVCGGVVLGAESAEKQAPKERDIPLFVLRLLSGVDRSVNILLATSNSCWGNLRQNWKLNVSTDVTRLS